MSWLVVVNAGVVSGAVLWYIRTKYFGARKLKDDESEDNIFDEEGGVGGGDYESFRPAYSNSGNYSGNAGIPRPRHTNSQPQAPLHPPYQSSLQHQVVHPPPPLPPFHNVQGDGPPPPPPYPIHALPHYPPPPGLPRAQLPPIPQQSPIMPVEEHCWLQTPPQQTQSQNSASRTDEIDPTELKLGKVLGGGSFGVVHQGVWRGTAVAVKILKSGQSTATAIEEFKREVTMLSRLRHPNICLFMGACMKEGSHTIVTELISRGSLWDVLREPQHNTTALPQRDGCGEWTWERLLVVARGIACGMAYLHGIKPHAVLHRDLKSSNILCDQSYCPKICDFGLSRLKAQTVPSVLSTRLNQAVMTGNCGTIQWMAPEVLSNQKYSETADVYSFGIILWELLVQDCPYGETTPQVSVALAVVQHGDRPQVPDDCPEKYRILMNRCWAQDPLQRPSFQNLLSPGTCSLEEACRHHIAPVPQRQVPIEAPPPNAHNPMRPLSFRGPGLARNNR